MGFLERVKRHDRSMRSDIVFCDEASRACHLTGRVREDARIAAVARRSPNR